MVLRGPRSSSTIGASNLPTFQPDGRPTVAQTLRPKQEYSHLTTWIAVKLFDVMIDDDRSFRLILVWRIYARRSEQNFDYVSEKRYCGVNPKEFWVQGPSLYNGQGLRLRIDWGIGGTMNCRQIMTNLFEYDAGQYPVKSTTRGELEISLRNLLSAYAFSAQSWQDHGRLEVRTHEIYYVQIMSSGFLRRTRTFIEQMKMLRIVNLEVEQEGET
ncbi:hypothetical protein EV361DRAFT_1037189 [Lentinula raphanica]|uniref:Uncharacterized protein n=1 Tax=Lentinula raphanica TaxID=153919 RepID=A0AA38UKX8_9AGAR|nr:hypothetical protein F5880DRAFT_1501958 [Lentinula raphanica]KAJ3844591.1 hypothetical protein F5878DRAFT_637230 [Lentinula raphanica]KAJ3965986.1 hypothetical protein EV361DRAFT_1037189 [Lentinula raphanica]